MQQISGEHPCRSVISINLQRNFVEITLLHECSPVNLLQFFITLFHKNTSGRLLLSLVITTNPVITFIETKLVRVSFNSFSEYCFNKSVTI